MASFLLRGQHCPLLAYILADAFYRLAFFRSRMAHVFSTAMQDEESMFLKDLLQHINQGLPAESLFGTAEATDLCNVMGEHDELMISEGIVYKV
jgi:DNA replication licensing factor MCM3